MSATPTAAEVISEGQILVEYFPKLDKSDEQALPTYVGTSIALVVVVLKRRLGSAYDTTDADEQLILKNVVIYLTLARLWQTITAVMIGFAGSELPREYIDPKEAADLRDSYAGEAEALLSQFVEPTEESTAFAAPYLNASGTEIDSNNKRKIIAEILDGDTE